MTGRWLFELVLKPLILRDYRLRAAGKRPDRWYWADRLGMALGHSVPLPHLKEKGKS